MRVPDKSKLFKESPYGENDYVTKSIKPYVKATRNQYNLEDNKDRDKFIKKDIESCVRQSYEYSVICNVLRNSKDMRKCAYTGIRGKGISIEIHHTPFSLYDIAAIVVAKHRTEYGFEINSLEISEEITQLHFESKVGLIPLSKTVHELVHSGYCFIPVTSVYGANNLSEFYSEYENYMTTDQKMLYEINCKASKILETPPEILKRKFIYLDYIEKDNFRFPNIKTLEDIIECQIPIPA